MKGPMRKNWEKEQMSAHSMEDSTLTCGGYVGWLAGKENDLIRVPGMKSILPREWLSRTRLTNCLWGEGAAYSELLLIAFMLTC